VDLSLLKLPQSCLCYWHISLVSNPRRSIPPVADVLGDFLPTLFVLYTFWRMVFRHLVSVIGDDGKLQNIYINRSCPAYSSR
jgi:hypothetical protein